MRTIDHEELLRILADPDLVLLDVLPPKSYAKGHLPNAVSLPLEELEARAAELIEAGDRVVVDCVNETCNRAEKAAEALERLGFEDVRVYAPGTKGWSERGGSLMQGPGDRCPRNRWLRGTVDSGREHNGPGLQWSPHGHQPLMIRGAIETLGLGVALLLFAFAGRILAAGPSLPERENVLLIVVDDLGIEKTGVYGFEGLDGQPLAARTPNIDRIAGQGILFRNAWAAPSCSPARAELLTGRYPNRTGIGSVVRPYENWSYPQEGLRDDWTTIPDLLPPEYVAGIIGKWHLARRAPLGFRTGGIDHAARCGFDFHVGTFANLEDQPTGYFSWGWLASFLGAPEASRVETVTTYATNKTTDDALRAIHSVGERPFFLWVAYHAPHDPYHLPPAHLFDSADLDLETELGQAKAMIEALDTEIGRLLEGISPSVLARTTVILVSDNGSQRHVVEPPWDPQRVKSTVYNGGVHVPFLVMSPHTPAEHRGEECERLIDVTDVMPTVAELVGLEAPDGVDGTSFLPYLRDPQGPPRRKWIYAERFRPNFDPRTGGTLGEQDLTVHLQAVRESRYKLLHIWKQGDIPVDEYELYDLEVDFLETENLLESPGGLPDHLVEVRNRLRRVLDDMAE